MASTIDVLVLVKAMSIPVRHESLLTSCSSSLFRLSVSLTWWRECSVLHLT